MYTLVILNKKETGVAGDPAPKNQTPIYFYIIDFSPEDLLYKKRPISLGLKFITNTYSKKQSI